MLKASIAASFLNILNIEDCCILRCRAMQSVRLLPLSQRNLLPPSLVHEMKLKEKALSKTLYCSTRSSIVIVLSMRTSTFTLIIAKCNSKFTSLRNWGHVTFRKKKVSISSFRVQSNF
jgi:hypothetical protein